MTDPGIDRQTTGRNLRGHELLLRHMSLSFRYTCRHEQQYDVRRMCSHEAQGVMSHRA